MIIAVFICLILYVLYWRGFLPVSVKRATMFLASGGWGSRCLGASFTGCDGSIRRVLRFPEARSYSFQLSGHVSRGAVAVQIMDGRHCALELTANHPSGILRAEAGKGYAMIVRFRNASGDYQLEWA